MHSIRRLRNESLKMTSQFLKSLEREVSNKLLTTRGSNYAAVRIGGLHGSSERYFNGNIKGVKFERHKRTIQGRKFDRPVKVT